MPAAELQMALVEIVQAVARAHAGHLFRRFVVARQHVDLVAAPRRIFAAALDALDQVTWSPAAI